MHIVESEIEEKGTLPHRRHPFQGGICQGIRCVSACGIAVGVLLETEFFGFHEDIKALPGGSGGDRCGHGQDSTCRKERWRNRLVSGTRPA